VAASGGSGANCGSCRSEQNFGCISNPERVREIAGDGGVIQSPAVNPAGIWKSVSAWARARGPRSSTPCAPAGAADEIGECLFGVLGAGM